MIFGALNAPPVTLWAPLFVMARWSMFSTASASLPPSWMVAPLSVIARGPMLMPSVSVSSRTTV